MASQAPNQETARKHDAQVYAQVQQQEVDDLQESGQHGVVQKSWWKPFWTSRLVFAVFIISFCGLLVSLEVILQLSKRRRGLVRTEMSRSWAYAWTYGPTASEFI